MVPLDILFLTLSVCVALVTIFLSMTLIYLMFILRDTVKVTDQIKEIVDKVNTYVTKPLLLTKSIIEFVGPFMRNAEEKINTRRRRD
jgi:hypothetical protein